MPIERNIRAFASLIESQPDLFRNSQTELADLCNRLPDNVEEISATVIEWCKKPL